MSENWAGNTRCSVNNELCTSRFGGTPKKGKYAGQPFCSFHYGRAARESDNLYSTEFGPGKYRRELRKDQEECPVPGCTEKQLPIRGLCPKHHKQAWRYRVSDYDYLMMLENPVCSNEGCDNTGNLVMDHDHACCERPPTCGNCNRSWLCISCNVALGMIHDSPQKLRGLLAYLEEYGRL